MSDAFTADWQALGLPDHSPFAILARPRAQAPAPVAPKPKKHRPTRREKVLASLREPGETNFNVPIMTRAESDRTLAIAGRGLA